MTRTWASQSGPAPMPMVGIDQLAGHLRRHVTRYPLEDDRKGTCVLERVRIRDQPLPVAGTPGLDLRAAERVDGLGREPEVTHHRDPPLRETADRLDHPAAALELDRVHPCLQVLDRVVDGIPAGALIRPKGEVTDQQLVGGTTRHGAGVVEHLGHRHREGVGIPEDVVGDGVPHQEHRYLRLREQPRGRVVVCREHDEPPSRGFPRREVPDGDAHGHATWVVASPAAGWVARSDSIARVRVR